MNARTTAEMQKFQTIQFESPLLNEDLNEQVNGLERKATTLIARYGLTVLRLSVGLVFVWFGALKLFPGLSPAEPLIRDAISFLPLDYFLPVLALWEVAIGVGFLTGKFQRATIILMLMQMGGAMSPLFLAPDRMWEVFPYQWSLEGQYVFKDIILISAALVIYVTVRGGGLTEKRYSK